MERPEESQTPQAEEQQKPMVPGSEEIQAPEGAAAVQREEEGKPAGKPERQYTEKEWQEREAARDREVAQLRQYLSRQALQMEMLQAQAAEERAILADQQAVDQGEMTLAEARQRQQEREAERQTQTMRRQQEMERQQTMERQMAAAAQVLQEAEQAGRILAAQDLAKEYQIDAGQLLTDTSITNYDQMRAKALELAYKAAKAQPETFDSGYRGGAAPSIESMTPLEKIRHALSRPQRR